MFKKSNRPFSIAACIAIVVTAFLLFNRHWDINESIKESVLEAWGTIMAAIFTAVTVYLLFKQNQQQLEDRKAANQPDLYPAEQTLFTDDSEFPVTTFSKEVHPTFYMDTKLGEFENPGTHFFLHNIGLGACKEIKANWSYDVREVDKLYREFYYPIWEYDPEIEILDFVSANSKIRVQLPQHYIVTCGRKINEYLYENELERPKLGLNLTFKDIYNNETYKAFHCEITANSYIIHLKFKQVEIDNIRNS